MKKAYPGLAMVEMADDGHIAGQLRGSHEACEEEGVVRGGLGLSLCHLQLLCLDGLDDGHLQFRQAS